MPDCTSASVRVDRVAAIPVRTPSVTRIGVAYTTSTDLGPCGVPAFDACTRIETWFDLLTETAGLPSAIGGPFLVATGTVYGQAGLSAPVALAQTPWAT